VPSNLFSQEKNTPSLAPGVSTHSIV